MSKYQAGSFLQIPRKTIQSESFKNLSPGAKALYLWLKELEHSFCGSKESVFFHTDKEISCEMNMSERSVERYRKELIDAKIIQFSRRHFVNESTKKKSEKRIACYEFVDDG